MATFGRRGYSPRGPPDARGENRPPRRPSPSALGGCLQDWQSLSLGLARFAFGGVRATMLQTGASTFGTTRSIFRAQLKVVPAPPRPAGESSERRDKLLPLGGACGARTNADFACCARVARNGM